MRRHKQVCLSAFLPARTEIANKLLALPGRSISAIDEVNPYLASEVESLDLHDNRLASLKGIEQFSCLKELDISENRLQRGEELLRLKQLPQLRKLYLGNNPLLNEPIPEAVLELMLDKETDIEVLSFEVLSTLRDVEEREIKIIFLKNYIQKLGLHSQLRSRGGAAPQHALHAEEVLSKLVPQFYTLIEDPRLISKIKREAIDKKKQSRESIGEALEEAKQQREEKIDELVKNIVELLHRNEEFKKSRSFLLEVNLNDNTISFSPERRREPADNISLVSGEFSPVKYIEMSKDDASLEDISFTNGKQPPTAAHTHAKPFEARLNEETLQMSSHRHGSPARSDLDNLETARRHSSIQTISEKMRSHTEFKQNVQSQIRKIRERESLASSKVAQSPCLDRDAPTPTSQKKKAFDMTKVKKNLAHSNNFIKVIEENQDESQENKSSLEEKEVLKHEPANTKRMQNTSMMNQSSIQLGDQPTPEAIQTIYYRSLAKINPMFSLLHSPSSSLNSEEKTELLEALKGDHKEKFIELLKERLNNQRLMREVDQLRHEHAREVEGIITNNKSVYDQYLVYKEQFEWIDARQRSIQAKNEELGSLLREAEASEKKKATALHIMETNFKKLKEACAEKHQRIIFLENAEEREESIRQKREAIVLRRYLKQIGQRAGLWSKVTKLSEKVVKNRAKSLLLWGMESFIFNRLQEKAARHQLRTHHLSILRQHLSQWLVFKELQQKEKAGAKWVIQRRSREMMQLLKKNEAASKMRKLKQIWARRFLVDRLYSKSMKNWKSVKSQADSKKARAAQHLNIVTLDSAFQGLKQIVISRKDFVEGIYQKRTHRLIGEEFKRMVYIMRKETAEIEQKYRKTAALRENIQRKAYFKQFMMNTCNKYQLQSKKKALKNYLIAKNIASFKKIQRSVSKKLSKLRNLCHGINFGVNIKMMRRQKASNDYSLVLARRQKLQFLKSLRKNWHQEGNFHKSQQKMALIFEAGLRFNKLKFLKRLEVFKLRGKNYVKHRAIQELSHQMDLNDQNAIDLIRNEKEEISRCEKEIHFLKAQIQGQSVRELALLRQKDEMMLSISESYEIMMELRKEVDAIRGEYGGQEQKYNALVALYNQSVAALQKKERDYEWLYDSLRSHQIN